MLLTQTFLASAFLTLAKIPIAHSVALLADAIASDWTIGQVVHTTSGYMKGHAASLSPTVSEYLGIRYAQPATRQLRFAAPVAYRSSGNIPSDVYVRNMDPMDYGRVIMNADAFDNSQRMSFCYFLAYEILEESICIGGG